METSTKDEIILKYFYFTCNYGIRQGRERPLRLEQGPAYLLMSSCITNRCASVTCWPMCTKCALRIHIGHTRDTWGPNSIRWKFKMAAAAVLNFVFGHISVNNKDICEEFGTQVVDIGHTSVTVVQNPTFGKIQDGGQPPFWKHTNCSILATFGDLHQIWTAASYWPYESYWGSK